MKRMLSLVLCCLTTLLFACSSQPRETITLFHHHMYNEELILKKVIKKFEKSPQFNVKVKLKYIEFSVMEGMYKFPPIDRPDIFIGPHDWIGKMKQVSFIEPVDELIERLKDRFVPSTLPVVRYENHYYAVPFTFEYLALFYNKKLVAKAPATLSELTRYAANFTPTDKIQYAFFTSLSAPYFVLPWLFSFGGRVFDDQGNIKLNDPATIQAFAQTRRLFQQMKFPFANDNTGYQMFVKGNLPLYTGGPWSVKGMIVNRIDFGVAPFPKNDISGKAIKPFMGVQCFYVVKQEGRSREKTKAIHALLDKLSGYEVGKENVLKAHVLSAIARVYSDDVARRAPVIHAFRALAEQTLPMPSRPEMRTIWDSLNAGVLRLLFNPGTDLTKSLNAIQKKIDRTKK